MKRLLKKQPETKGVKKLVKKPAPLGKNNSTGKSLKKPDPKPEKKLVVKKKADTGPSLPVQVRPVMPKGYKWKTLKTVDLVEGGVKLHRVDPTNMPKEFPVVHPKLAPNTVFRINKETGKCHGMVTVMPDGVNVAWDVCGGCNQHVSICTCRNGIIHGKGVEHIYISSLARSDGVDLGHPIDVTQHEFTQRAIYHYAQRQSKAPSWSRTEGDWKPSNGGTAPERPKRLTKAAERPTEPQKRLLKKPAKGGKTKGPVADVENLSISKLNKDAKGQSESAVDELTKRLSKPSTPTPGKRPRKKGK